MQKPDQDQTFDRIRDGVSNLFKVPVDHITADSTYDDLGLDSMDFFELTIHLEDEFKIEIDSKVFAEKNTFGEMVDYVRSLASDNANG
jgi:acyl carrier protein